jgi:hypothetical protein
VRRIGFALALTSALLATAAPVALAKRSKTSASPVQQVINDCETNGKLTRHYPEKLLAQALADMQTSTLQYSNCEDVIQAAELAEINGKNSAAQNRLGTSNTRTPSPAADAGKLRRAARGGVDRTVVNGVSMTPGAVVLHGTTLLGALPTPLLIALLALLGTGAVLGEELVRRHVRSRRAR